MDANTQPRTEPRTDVFCFDHARPPPERSEPPLSRPSPGFYRCETTDFYVTADGRVFLLRTPDEPACLHQCHALPSLAVPSSARVEPALEILARAADELARPSTARMRSIRDEVRRDRLVAVAALLQETLACASEGIERLLLDECPPDPAGLHERLVERLDSINRQRLALDNQGINRRGERQNVPAPGPDVPPAVAPFVHRGEYIGWSVGIAAVVASLPGMPETTAELRDAHMRGELWTIARDGLVYVFRCTPTDTSNTDTSKETAA
jgi:hypothetical protein